MTNKWFILLITTLTTISTTCESTYLKYYIEDYCFNSNIDPHIELLNDSVINNSILLYSSRIGHKISNKTCGLRIEKWEKTDGFIVTVQNISINNTLSKKCEDYIEFGLSPVGKWCNTTEAQSLIFSNSGIDIVFNARLDSSSYFEIVITPYQNSVSGKFCTTSAPFMCEKSNQLQCIAEGFRCDSVKNCPHGWDESNCSKFSTVDSITDICDTSGFHANQSFKATTHEKTLSDETLLEVKTDYKEYNILEFCNSGFAHEIMIESNSNGTVSPALLVLSHNKTNISNQTCVIRFSLPASKWYPQNGLILGIDEISIKSNTNKSCDDYIQISGSDFKSQFQWCENKTDEIGQSFRGSGYIDIIFHVGEDSKSEFKLVITPFEDPIVNMCFKTSELKCSDNGNYECISKQYRSDGHRNCPNGDDESSTPTPTTSTTTQTTPTTLSTTTSGNISFKTTTYVTSSDETLLEVKAEYKKYNILEFCNSGFAHEIKIESNSNGTATPALLVLSPNSKTKISHQTCVIRFSLPTSEWYLPQKGLILGIDKISIKSNTNKSCDDYIELSDSSERKTQLKWCENKTDEIGKSFRGSGYIDFIFHAGEDSKSEFKLVLTPFKGLLGNLCFKSELKCSDDGNYECISKQYQWDGHNNCPNGDDEAGRLTPTPTISTTTTSTQPK